MEDEILKHAIHRLIEKHGPAAVTLELAAYVGWQGRYYPAVQAERIAKAAQDLAEAHDLLNSIEQEDARDATQVAT